MRSINDKLSSTISFEGINVKEAMEARPRMYEATWKAAGMFPNSIITISVSPSVDDIAQWSMSIASPTGRKTLDFTQSGEGGVHCSENL